MKKVIVNADIMAMYKTLNSMKSRADLIAGDVDGNVERWVVPRRNSSRLC